MSNFKINISINLTNITEMAKLKGLFNWLSGSIGDVTFSRSEGQTIVYEKAEHKDARTLPQLKVRTVMANLAALYSAARGKLKNSFEGKTATQNDYNMFIKKNMSSNSHVYLTKEQSEAKACVVAPYYITGGSLGEIKADYTDDGFQTNISLGDLILSEETTIGQFSSAVKNSNKLLEFAYSDKLVALIFQQTVDAEGIPHVLVDDDAVTLDDGDDRLLLSIVHPTAFASVNGKLGSVSGLGDVGIAWILCRNDENRNWQISTSKICCNNSLLEEYMFNRAFERAAKSYGGYKKILLTADGTSSSSHHDDPTPTGKYRLTVQSESLDKGTVSGGGMFEEGANPTFSATPKAGYEFEGWYRDGEKFSEEATCTDFDMPAANVTVIAKFRAVAATHTITLTAGANGKVKVGDGESSTTATGTVEDGGTIVINAIADSGYQFQKWSDNNMQNPRTLTNVTEDVELTATFESEE